MKIKIKSKPEDFCVEEIANLPFSKGGEFQVYRLRKSGWNTVELLQKISHDRDIPFANFSYGGRKDRHAQTSQYITIKSPEILRVRELNYSLEHAGAMHRAMAPDLIEGNSFKVVIRKLHRGVITSCQDKIKSIEQIGFPNYFDDQRFASFDQRQGFLAEKALKGEFNGALKIYLTFASSEDSAQDKQRKDFFFVHWGKWQDCLARSSTDYEKKVFSFLLANNKGYLDLLRAMPHERLISYLSSYQSFLWNEMLRKVIIEICDQPLDIYPGIAGDYLFFSRLREENYRELGGLEIPTCGTKINIEHQLVKKIYDTVLEEHGIRQGMFNGLKVRQAFFKSFTRRAVVKPRDFGCKIGEDEVYAGFRKMVLKFTLPRGSFGTMLVKRIMSASLLY